MSGINGLRGTGNWGTDERPKDFREGILFYQPNGNSPIFALSSKASKKTVTDPEFFWWAEAQTSVRLQAAQAHGSGDTLITVDSPDPSASNMSLLYGNATHLKPGDVLMVEPAADAAAFTPEMLLVENVMSDTQFTVRRGFAGTTPATIGNDIWMLLIGSSYAEGTDAPRAVSRNPTKFSNLTQIFKDTYELTGTADATKVRTGNPWSNDKKRKAFDHAMKIEWAFLFGQKSETVGENGKPQRTMDGIRKFIPAANTTVFGAPVTPSSFLDALAPAFNFDINGSGNRRVAFAGNRARIEMGKAVFAQTNVQVQLGNPISFFGMDFERFMLPMGEILMKTHPLLSSHPLYQKSIIVMDFNNIKYVTLKGRDTKEKDDVQSKSEDLRRGFWQTECSIMVDGGGMTFAYLGNVSAT